MPPAFQWARLKADVQCALRKGAWYRILKLTSTEVVLDVRGKPLSVPRGQLQLSSEPALRWSVVPSPKQTARFPATWGASYAVCPNCRDRAMPRTGATLNVPDNRPPTGFTLMFMVMLPAKAESGRPRLSRTST